MKLPALFIAILGMFAQQTADPLVLFLSRTEEPVHSYRGSRTMEGKWGKSVGSLELTTEFKSGIFSYREDRRTGSENVINRALKPLLEGEQAGSLDSSAFNTKNYAFSVEDVERSPFVPIKILPKRKEVGLLHGHLFVRRDTGELARVEGRPAKDPSNWTKDEKITRYYERVGGIRVPVKVVVTARVLFRDSTVTVHYRYQEINGKHVSTASP